VHHRPDGNLTFWTYFDRCTWAPEVGIDSFTSTAALALTSSSEGLVLARGSYGPVNKSFSNYTSAYTATPAPERLPQCLGAI